MVEIRYKNHSEAADLADKTLAEVREQLKEDFGIPYKAKANLNGRRVERGLESQTCLNDDDRLSFTGANLKGIVLIGGLLLALGITGGSYVYGFFTSTTTPDITAIDTDFVTVTANTSSTPQWTTYGQITAGSTGSGTLFDIDTVTTNYAGDMVVTISLINVEELVNVYRSLTLSIEIRDSSDNVVDINGDDSADSDDFIILTLSNAVVDLLLAQETPDVYTVRLRNGNYKSNPVIGGWGSGDQIPELFCEVNQR